MNKIYLFTGAGLSKPSGLHTFRDSDGLWSKYNLDEICNYANYKDNRELIFDFYNDRKRDILLAQPNEAHYLIADMQKLYGDNLIIYTQNVDNLLERAGCQNVIHLHGNIHEMKCHHCYHVWDIGDNKYEVNMRCPQCDSLKPVKPNVVFFGEPAPEYSKLYKLGSMLKFNNYFVSIGTSNNVLPMEVFMPNYRIGHDKNIQINPELVDEEWFGVNLALTAIDGLKFISETKLLES